MPKPTRRTSQTPPAIASPLRIIGGKFRGRLLQYGGDPRTRPMKDRVREAVFNLVGPSVVGKDVIDLFAGTGALGLEALSRGAAQATFIERHVPTASVIQQNAALLEVAERTTVIAINAFFWVTHDWQPTERPVLVFCSPPYDFYLERHDEMLAMIEFILQHAAAESMVVVESDERFDTRELPASHEWRIRTYAPAVVAIGRVV